MIAGDMISQYLRKIDTMEKNLVIMKDMLNSNDIDIERYENCFNDIMDNLNGFVNYNRLRPRVKDKIITWKYVQDTDNYFDKFIFARYAFSKFLDGFSIIKNNSQDIILLVNLGFYLERITNVNNVYFDLTETEAFLKVFKSNAKSLNIIFKDDIKFLAYDYRKFLDIDKFSDEDSRKFSDEPIRINQEEGLKLYDIDKLIYNFKLKEAMDLLYSSIGPNKLPVYQWSIE